MNKSLFVLLFLIPAASFGQDFQENMQEVIEDRIDFLLDREESEDMDYTTLFEQLQFYYENPIPLNSSTFEELQSLQLMNDIQINNLLLHIKTNGDLIAFEELQSISGFDLRTLQQIRPFVTVTGKSNRKKFKAKKILTEGKSQFFVRYSRILEEKEGYLKDKYAGSPYNLYTRYKFNYANNISLGFTAEKDPGEEFFKGSNPNGFDFYSAHIFMQNLGVIDQLAVGDFQAQFGQGLTFSSGLSFGISPEVQSIKRNARGLAPYTSAQENLFMRGIGTTFKKRKFKLTLFYSSHKVDANISSIDTNSGYMEITSLPTHGFHRTSNELEDKNVVRMRYIGSHISYRNRALKLGATAIRNEIEAEYNPNIKLYNQFSQPRNTNTNLGFDYDYTFKNISVFGEISHSLDGGIAYTNAALLVIDPRLSLAIQNRNYEESYVPMQSSAIGEASTNTNEKGTYIGLNANPAKHFYFSAYVDRFSFPWLRYLVDAPSQGYRHLLQLEFAPNKQFQIYVRYRNRNKGKNNAEESENIRKVAQESLENYRLHLSYRVSEDITLKNRVEFLQYSLGENTTENGVLIYQDFQYKRKSSPLSFTLRFALFDTDSYNSRVYAYENDVLYAFSIPAYYGKGSRFYLVTKYRVARNCDVWLKYSQTYFTDRTSIGSGNEKIEGNTKSQLKLQMRFKF